MCVGAAGGCHSTEVKRKFAYLVLSFNYVGPWDRTHVTSRGHRHLSQASNITGSDIASDNIESLSILEALRGLGWLGRELDKELSKYFKSRKPQLFLKKIR